MNEDISKILTDRKHVYGDYTDGTRFRADMMNLITNFHTKQTGKILNTVDLVAIFDIVNKLSRIAVSPGHRDSWKDLVGYSIRNLERLDKEEEEDAIKPKAARLREPSYFTEEGDSEDEFQEPLG